MTVDVTYCLSEWETYFTEKPLSFNEFVDTYRRKDAIYPHILKTVDEISKHPSKLEYFIQGFIGSGKSTLINLLFAYKVYLYLILKSAQDFYNVTASTKLCAVFYTPNNKSASFMVNSLMQTLTDLPFFKKVHTLKECFDYKETAIYTTAYPDNLLTFMKGDNVLHVISAKNESDIVGINPIFGVLTELGNVKQQGIPIESVFNFYQKLSWRIDSRCCGKLSTIIVEKAPDNYYDVLDRYIYGIKDPSKMVIFFHYYWKVFDYKDPGRLLDSTFNITTCSVVDDTNSILPGDNFIDFPSVFQGIDFLKLAREHPESFLRDYIGMPVFIKKNSETFKVMKDIVDKIHRYNLEVCIKNGNAYLECPNEKLSICLSDYSD